MKKLLILASLLLSSTLSFAFDFKDITKSVLENVTNNNTKTNSVNSNLDNSTASSGLKEALKIGVNYAVKSLGANNGYLNNSLVKIPLPDNLAKAETLIRKVGGDEMANNLITSMNNAATKAAPKTADIFINAINNMSLIDAKNILAGGNNAATNYFKSNTTNSLKKMITPIIQETMKENQVASYYNTINNFYKSNVSSLVDTDSVKTLAKSFGVDSYIPSTSDKDLDEYVTNKAIEGLFKMIAQKEGQIRNNPAAQTTSLLKQVFGK